MSDLNRPPSPDNDSVMAALLPMAHIIMETVHQSVILDHEYEHGKLILDLVPIGNSPFRSEVACFPALPIEDEESLFDYVHKLTTHAAIKASDSLSRQIEELFQWSGEEEIHCSGVIALPAADEPNGEFGWVVYIEIAQPREGYWNDVRRRRVRFIGVTEELW